MCVWVCCAWISVGGGRDAEFQHCLSAAVPFFLACYVGVGRSVHEAFVQLRVTDGQIAGGGCGIGTALVFVSLFYFSIS
ncbi:hypothetical protein PSV09DRAFT_2306186 [Bipolaris maydis]|nr:hypothetical protein J3E74DRAFT_346414 [Bipolaris maydis]KAJ6209288.1 hypothetical protein PSV09DRAFT_2306186 [Bipolaris maydis]KAJ6282237.1 hypothetical protein J3E71DRAFT_284126 [Bipolaris maydis]